MTDQTDLRQAPPAPAPARRRAWVGWALVGSLCVNLLLLGAIGGAVLRHGGPHPAPPAGLDPVSLMRVMRNLPDDRRDEAREILRDHRPKYDALRPARIASRLAIAAALEAEPLEIGVLSAALDDARRAEAQGREVIDDAFVEFAAQLPIEARRHLAEEIREARRWRGHDRDRHERRSHKDD